MSNENDYTPIPDWDARGLLPVKHPVTLSESPYKATSGQFVAATGTTPERKLLLRGWLDLRRELYAIGLVDGWQWVNGSFVENIEFSENRPPNDIDVVTFVRFPKNASPSFSLWHARLLYTQQAKAEFGVDAFYQDMRNVSPSELEASLNYWHDRWSHTRSKNEKGFIEVRLSSDDDQKAMKLLNLMEVK